jgi:hypothetical protein
MFEYLRDHNTKLAECLTLSLTGQVMIQLSVRRWKLYESNNFVIEDTSSRLQLTALYSELCRQAVYIVSLLCGDVAWQQQAQRTEWNVESVAS